MYMYCYRNYQIYIYSKKNFKRIFSSYLYAFIMFGSPEMMFNTM